MQDYILKAIDEVASIDDEWIRSKRIKDIGRHGRRLTLWRKEVAQDVGQKIDW